MLRIQLLIAFLCVALVVYFVLLGRIATAFIVSGRRAAIGLGLALMILPLIGIWVMVSTLRAGLAHQRLARIIHDEGMELDVSALPRMPSGRSAARPPTSCSTPSAKRSSAIPTTGGAGTGWPAPTTTRATAPGRRETMGKATVSREEGDAMSKTLLIVHHTPSPHTHEMFEAVRGRCDRPRDRGRRGGAATGAHGVAGRHAGGRRLPARHPGQPRLHVGRLKHAFDCRLLPAARHHPWATVRSVLHGNEGTEGAERAVEAITTGLGWVKAAETVVVSGKPDKADVEACWELGATIAAQLMEG